MYYLGFPKSSVFFLFVVHFLFSPLLNDVLLKKSVCNIRNQKHFPSPADVDKGFFFFSGLCIFICAVIFICFAFLLQIVNIIFFFA